MNVDDLVRTLAVDSIRRHGPMDRRTLQREINTRLAQLGVPVRVDREKLRDLCRPMLAAEQVRSRTGRVLGLRIDLAENVELRRALRAEKRSRA